MEVLRVAHTNSQPPSTYIPDEIVEGYTSMIWTERYMDPGEFELKTPYVTKMRALLPEMSFITLRDSKEVMMVETHAISRDDEGYSTLTIKGRTLDAFLENRYLEGPYNKRYAMNGAFTYSAAEAAGLLIWNAFVNTTEQDATHAADWFRFSTDALPSVVVTDSTSVATKKGHRFVQGGQVHPQVIKFLEQKNLGVRVIRPNSGPAKVLTFDPLVTTGFRNPMTTQSRSITELRFDIYDGDDRTSSQTALEPVIFHYDSGHIEGGEFVFSIKDYKTVASIASQYLLSGGIRIFEDKGTGDAGSATQGWSRRGLWVDGGDPDAGNSAEWSEGMLEAGMGELLSNKRTNAFDGQTTENTPYRYNQHYFLGDKVSLLAGYNINQTMRVGEYVRTEDEAGERGFPGLVVIA